MDFMQPSVSENSERGGVGDDSQLRVVSNDGSVVHEALKFSSAARADSKHPTSRIFFNRTSCSMASFSDSEQEETSQGRQSRESSWDLKKEKG